MLTHLECSKCKRRHERGLVHTVCVECGSPLLARYDLARAALEMRPGHLELREPTMWRYREVLPLEDPAARVTLGEGMTPLVPAPRLGARLGLQRLVVKEEGGNPTGSFKARGLSMAVSMAKALGATDVCLPSAGNAGSALAAYAAAAGLKAHVFLPKDVARLFVMETEAYGAHVERVDGLITDAGRACAVQAKRHGWYECATLKEPYRIEGKKTMGYEIAEQMGWTLPDAILYPTGGGTGLVGMWKAFAEMEAMGFVGAKRPRMYAVQAEGCAPIVKAFQEGREEAPYWEGATTHAHGLRVPKALGDFLVLRALRESHGAAIAVSEQEIVLGVKEGASCQGLFVSPETGATLAAFQKLRKKNWTHPGENVVLFHTGGGAKYAHLWGGVTA
jgi:threonine synthase